MGGYLLCHCKHATVKANPSLVPHLSAWPTHVAALISEPTWKSSPSSNDVFINIHIMYISAGDIPLQLHCSVWLIFSWNTVLVAWLLSSSVANYIAWPLPAWCITPLLRLAPLWPLTPALQPPSSLFVSLKSSFQTLQGVRPFLVHLISAPMKYGSL